MFYDKRFVMMKSLDVYCENVYSEANKMSVMAIC